MTGGKQVSVTATASRQSWDHDKWTLDSTTEELREDFQGWDSRLVQLLEKVGDTDIWAMFDLSFPRTFVPGNVVILGDTAHASTPSQGNGTAMAIEDAYLLANLLVHAADKGQHAACTALETYDKVRRPRTQRQVHTAMEAGWIFDLESPKFGEDIEAIKKISTTRLHWLWDIDLGAELQKAIRTMHARRFELQNCML